jgi:hypothetical protein
MIKIGAISIPDEAAFDIRQSYTPLGGKALLRTKNGAAILQQRWQKLSSTITGSGWLPDGLDAVDVSASQAVYCIAPLSVLSASNVITIPRTFRTDGDYVAQGVAIVGGEMLATPAAVAGQVATLTVVAGATQYMVVYYPVITGFITVDRQFDEANQLQSWTIDVQQA